jgi:hypothetical protein
MINHNENKFTDAIDMNDQEYKALEKKMKNLIHKTHDKEMRLSNVYDEIQKTFSYKELVFCTTQHLYYLYKESNKSTEKEFIKDLLDLLKDL